MLCRISKANDLHQDFASLFPDSDRLQTLALEYMAVIVVISTEMILYMQKSRLKQMVSSPFAVVFSPLEATLKDIGEQIRICADFEANKQSQKSHALTHRLISAARVIPSHDARQRELESRRHVLLNTIRPGSSSEKTFRDLRTRGDSVWIFEEQTFESWRRQESSSLLCLCGNLGSGKSIVMASVVSHLTRMLGSY